jgi:L-ascorbate metabolism protein UlaG (beta-lactamase superfamily)
VFETVPAYNIDKAFHPKKMQWVGYILVLAGKRYYYSGDTDYIPEMEQVEADVVFLPVGGTYMMTAAEAVKAANTIKPKVAVPFHFGKLVGSQKDAERFIEKLDKTIQGTILKTK